MLSLKVLSDSDNLYKNALGYSDEMIHFTNSLTVLGMSSPIAYRFSEYGVNNLKDLFLFCINNQLSEIEKFELITFLKKIGLSYEESHTLIDNLQTKADTDYSIIKDLLIQYNEINQLKLSSALQQKLYDCGIYYLSDLNSITDYVNIININEFYELKDILVNKKIWEDDSENSIELITDNLAYNLCSKVINRDSYPIENLKIRVYIAFLLLNKNQRKIIKYQFFDENNIILSISKVANELNIESMKVYLANNLFFKKIKEPIIDNVKHVFLD